MAEEMKGRITSMETVAVIHYRDRWKTIVDNSGKLLLYTGKAGYSDYIKTHNDLASYVEIFYRAHIGNAFDALTMPEYFVLSFLVHPNLQELVDRYKPANYQLDEERSGLLYELFHILQRIKHILAYDRNQVISQVLSFCIHSSGKTVADFGNTLKAAFNQELLAPLPSPGFLKRTMLKQVLTGHQEPVAGIGLFHNGQLLVSIDGDGLLVWQLNNGQIIYRIDAGEERHEFTGLEVIEEQQIILAVSRDGRAIAWKWDFDKGRIHINKLSELIGERAFLDIRYYQKSNAAIATTKGKLLLWDFIDNTKEEIATGINSLSSLSFTPNGNIIVCGGAHLGNAANKIFKILERGTWKELYSSPEHEWPVEAVHAISDSMIISRANDEIRVYDIRDSNPVLKKVYGFTLATSSFIPGKNLLLTAQSNTIHVLDTPTGKEKKLVTTHHDRITTILARDDDDAIITAAFDQTIRIWDGNMLLNRMDDDNTHTDAITSLVAVDEWNCFLSSSRDGRVFVWDMSTLRPVKIIDAHTQQVSGIQPVNKQEFISYSWDGYVKFWDGRSFEKTGEIYFDGKHIVNAHYHAGEAKIILSEFNKTVWIYDVKKESMDKLVCNERIVDFFHKKDSEYWLITQNGKVLSLDYHKGFAKKPVAELKKKIFSAFYKAPYLFIVDAKENVYRYEPAKRKKKKLFRLEAAITGLVVLGNDQLLTINGQPHYISDNTLRIHDANGKILSQFTLDAPLGACAYSEKNKIACIGDIAGGIYFFQLR